MAGRFTTLNDIKFVQSAEILFLSGVGDGNESNASY